MAFQPKTARIVLHIVNHPTQLPWSMKDALVIIGRILLPDTTPARKYTGKLQGGIPMHSITAHLFPSVHPSGVLAAAIPMHSSAAHLFPSVHPSGVLAAAIELLLVNLSTAALESPHHRPYALRKRFQHLDYQMHMVRHNHLRQDFQSIAFPFIELRKPTEHLKHTSSKRIEPDKSSLSTLAF